MLLHCHHPAHTNWLVPLPQTHSFLNICCLGLICFLPSAFLMSNYLKDPMDGVLRANGIFFLTLTHSHSYRWGASGRNSSLGSPHHVHQAFTFSLGQLLHVSSSSLDPGEQQGCISTPEISLSSWKEVCPQPGSCCPPAHHGPLCTLLQPLLLRIWLSVALTPKPECPVPPDTSLIQHPNCL